MKIEKLFQRYSSIIPDFEKFLDYVKRPLTPSFRVNTLKVKKDQILLLIKDWQAKRLPFYEDGFSFPRNLPLGNHFVHKLGFIYLQEKASMIPPIVLGPKPGDVVLDLCGAPGSKATQIAQMMKNQGLLVINEVNKKRLKGLIFNVRRCGLLNEAIISIPGQKIDRVLPEYFDRILIDAPCSGEGTIRRSKAVLYHWGLKNIERMARLQKGLIVSGFRALSPGGTMVYSTCTLAPEENEAVVSYLLERFNQADILPINLPGFKLRPGIKKWQGISFDKRVENCARIFPQDNDTAPFFIARITKLGLYRPRTKFLGRIEFRHEVVEYLKKYFEIGPDRFNEFAIFKKKDQLFISTPEAYAFWECRALRKGLELGKFHNRDLKPTNDFIQLFGSRPKKKFLQLSEWQVKKFMNGDKIKLNTREIAKGFVILLYKNLPIGIGKFNGQELRSTLKRERRGQTTTARKSDRV